jgi:ribosome-binding protein aMBF1 (putative translation factor)
MSVKSGAAARRAAGPAIEDPVGRPVSAELAEALQDPEERAEHERLAAFEQLARLVIMRRGQLGLSQADLARRMDRPASVVSRIESGQHATNTATLKRLAEALDGRALLGFDFPLDGASRREVVEL